MDDETKEKWLNSIHLFIYILKYDFYIKVAVDLHHLDLKSNTLLDVRLLNDCIDFITSGKILVIKALGISSLPPNGNILIDLY